LLEFEGKKFHRQGSRIFIVSTMKD
jgi:hypothetical protein